MPSRHFAAAIVIFWLGTTGWMLYRDLWPRLNTRDAPPFTIDLDEEAGGERSAVHWIVRWKGQRVGSANTWVQRHWPTNDTYQLRSKYQFESFKMSILDVKKMDSTYWVTKEGELREVEAKVTIAIQGFRGPMEVKVTGVVEDHRLTPHLRITNSPLGDRELDLDAVEPWNRLADVRPNQRWQITVFDPLADSIAAALPGASGGTRTLEAGVRESTDQDFQFVRGQKTPCTVIEYRGENLKALTWIRTSDGLVLRQEAIRNENTPQEERLVLERDLQ